MRDRAGKSKDSLLYRATNISSGLVIEFKGLRAFCRAMWGENPDGTPKYISTAVDHSTGRRPISNVKGWVIKKVPVPDDANGNYIRSKKFRL